MKTQSNRERSSMTINAVAQAAAQGAPWGPATGRKITAVAALAGFVLRMFRQRATPPAAPQAGCKRPRRPARAGVKGGLNHG